MTADTQEAPDLFEDPLDSDIPLIRGAPRPREPQVAILHIQQKEGHCIMTLKCDSLGDPWTQSAGNEIEDALEKAKRKWGPDVCTPQPAEPGAKSRFYRFEWKGDDRPRT